MGADSLGRQALQELAAEGVDTSLVVEDPEAATGVALILTDAQGENMISVAPGANRALTLADIERATAAIRAARVLLIQLEVPLACVALSARIARAAGVPVILDPAPAPAEPLSRELLADVALIKPNEHEAARLTGVRVTGRASAHRATDTLLDLGVPRAPLGSRFARGRAGRGVAGPRRSRRMRNPAGRGGRHHGGGGRVHGSARLRVRRRRGSRDGRRTGVPGRSARDDPPRRSTEPA